METIVKLREQIKVSQLESNFKEAILEIENIIIDNEYTYAIHSVDGDNGGLPYIKTDFSNLSRNARKNLAKRIHFFNKKRTLKSINVLFLVFRKLGVINAKVTVSVSDKEKSINRLRTTYKIMKAKTEEARLAYKKEKGNFYKEKLAQ